MFEIVKAGGIIMVPLILCSIIAAAIILAVPPGSRRRRSSVEENSARDIPVGLGNITRSQFIALRSRPERVPRRQTQCLRDLQQREPVSVAT